MRTGFWRIVVAFLAGFVAMLVGSAVGLFGAMLLFSREFILGGFVALLASMLLILSGCIAIESEPKRTLGSERDLVDGYEYSVRAQKEWWLTGTVQAILHYWDPKSGRYRALAVDLDRKELLPEKFIYRKKLQGKVVHRYEPA